MTPFYTANVKSATICDPDVETISRKAPYTKYEQIRVNDNFRQYLEAALVSNKVFRTEIKKTPYFRSCKFTTGTQLYSVEFSGANRQFDFLV